MIAALWSAVVLATLVGAGSLTLSLLLARRYRELHQAVKGWSGEASAGGQRPAEGATVADFHTVATDGTPVSVADLADADVTVAVLMVGCEPCAKGLPDMARAFAAGDDGAARPLAVVIGEDARVDPFVSQLSPVARVVVEKLGGPVTRALGVSAFPTVLRVGAGRVKAVGEHLDDLRATIPA